MHRQSLIKNMAKEIETCEGTPVIEASDRDTLESKVQSEEFQKFCESVIGFKNYTIVDMKTGVSAHNNKLAWKLFMENVQERFSNVPGISKVEYGFCTPYLSRYYNATDKAKENVLKEFVVAMRKRMWG